MAEKSMVKGDKTEKPDKTLEDFGIGNETRFGWCCFKPKFLQCCNGIGWFTFTMSAFAFIKMYGFDGSLPAVVTTLEKRFNLSSKQSGLIFAAYDISFMLCVIPYSFFARKWSIPVMTSVSMILLAISCFIFAIPHFLSDPYDPFGSQTDDARKCNALRNDTCVDDGTNDEESFTSAYALFITSSLISGFAAIPLWTLGYAHMADQARKRTAPLLFGILSASSGIGVMLGLILGALMLGIYIDFDKDVPQLTDPYEAGFLGAWWLSFIIAGALALIFAVPMWGFPNQLKGVAQIKLEEQDHDKIVEPKFEGSEVGAMFHMLSKIWKNPIIVTILFAEVFESVLSSGVSAFGLKYLEIEFYLTPIEAGLFSGICSVVGAVLGMVGNGFIVKVYNLNVRQCCLLYLGQALTAILLLIPLFYVRCDNREIQGIFNGTTREVMDPIDLSNEFNQLSNIYGADCKCSEDVVSIYCIRRKNAEGEIVSDSTYFNPCFAGCFYDFKSFYEPAGINLTIYGGCEGSGLPPFVPSTNPFPEGIVSNYAAPGYCETECSWLWAGYAILFLNFLMSYGASVIVPTIMLRTVNEDGKQLVLANKMLMNKLLGGIPGPIIFGALVDNACIKEKLDCDGNFLTCQVYDADDLANTYLGASLLFKGIVVLCIVSCLFAIIRKEQIDAKRLAEKTVDVLAIEDEKTENVSSPESLARQKVDIDNDDLKTQIFKKMLY